MVELSSETESDPVYQCKICGRENLNSADMIFQTNSHTNRCQPYMCQACYVNHRDETNRVWLLKAREQDEARKACHQAIASGLRQAALAEKADASEPSV